MSNQDFIGEACPKCNNPECVGDCGTREEKEDFLNNRYFGKVKTKINIKNPLDKVSLGSYNPTHKNGRKAKG